MQQPVSAPSQTKNVLPCRTSLVCGGTMPACLSPALHPRSCPFLPSFPCKAFPPPVSFPVSRPCPSSLSACLPVSCCCCPKCHVFPFPPSLLWFPRQCSQQRCALPAFSSLPSLHMPHMPMLGDSRLGFMKPCPVKHRKYMLQSTVQ